jgi:flagellar secretion chaperone FliS
MNPYFEQVILSASPIELVRLMYQKAIASVTDARDHLKAGRIRERGQAINKAYAILAELLISLDAEKAPELVANLKRLYCYMQERLIEANLRQKDGPLEETARLLSTLADAWREVPETREYRDAYASSDCEDEMLACVAVTA